MIPLQGRGLKRLTMTSHPSPAGQISDSQLVTNQECLGLRQLRFHDAVQPAGLVSVSVDAVLNLLGRIALRRC